jgi:hypothetical protein
MPIDGVLYIDPAAGSGKRRGLGQGGKRALEGAESAIAALGVKAHVAVHNHPSAAVDLLPPAGRRGIRANVGMLGRTYTTLGVCRHFLGQVLPTTDGRAGESRPKILLLKIDEKIFVAPSKTVAAGETLDDVEGLGM